MGFILSLLGALLGVLAAVAIIVMIIMMKVRGTLGNSAFKEVVNAMKNAKDLCEFLKVKLGKIISIDAPNIYTESTYPEIDGGLFRVNMLKSAGTANSSAAEDNASENMTKQKVKASISMKIAIK